MGLWEANYRRCFIGPRGADGSPEQGRALLEPRFWLCGPLPAKGSTIPGVCGSRMAVKLGFTLALAIGLHHTTGYSVVTGLTPRLYLTEFDKNSIANRSLVPIVRCSSSLPLIRQLLRKLSYKPPVRPYVDVAAKLRGPDSHSHPLRHQTDSWDRIPCPLP